MTKSETVKEQNTLLRGYEGKMLIAILLLAFCVFFGLYATRSRSVLWRIEDKGTVDAWPIYSFFNPFRDRDPELEAERFLKIISAGQCDQALAVLRQGLSKQVDRSKEEESDRELCERERSYPLMSWTLVDRRDLPDTVKVYYM